MTCKEAERLVIPYIRDVITDDEMDQFIEHIKSCPSCRDELEIYFAVEVGIRQLDSEHGNYNVKGALEAAIEQSKQRIQIIRFIQIARYSVTTLSVLLLMMAVLLQCRIWLQQGFL